MELIFSQYKEIRNNRKISEFRVYSNIFSPDCKDRGTTRLRLYRVSIITRGRTFRQSHQKCGKDEFFPAGLMRWNSVFEPHSERERIVEFRAIMRHRAETMWMNSSRNGRSSRTSFSWFSINVYNVGAAVTSSYEGVWTLPASLHPPFPPFITVFNLLVLLRSFTRLR